MSQRVEVRIDQEAWIECQGTVVHLAGRRYRIVFTHDLRALVAGTGRNIALRVNGLAANDLQWVGEPRETATRGYVSVEATLAME